MSNDNEKSEEGGTLRYAVPFYYSVQLNIEGTITVEMPSDIPLPRRSAKRCVWEATKENGVFQEPLDAFKAKLPFCTVSCLPVGYEIEEPQRTYSDHTDSDLRMLWTIEDFTEEVQS